VNLDPVLPCLFSLITTSDSGTQAPAGPRYFGDPRGGQGNYGTSFSSPLVAAAAGLMVSVNPALTPATLTARLKATARPFPSTSDTQPQPPVCHVPVSATDVQDAECLCTTATCGVGMLDIGAAVRDAQRPVALATVIGTVGPARTLTLDGASSAASQGRTIASYAWSVASLADGATAPALATPAAPTTSMPSPTFGSVTLRLTVTDDRGAIDTADVTVTAANAGGSVVTPQAPPSTPAAQSSGGGGGLDAWLLAALGLLAARRLRPSRTRD
jgi:serine protease